MKRIIEISVASLLIIGFVEVAPATTVDSDSKKYLNSTSYISDDFVFADGDIKKKKKKKKTKLKSKQGGKKGGFWSKWKSKWKKKSSK